MKYICKKIFKAMKIVVRDMMQAQPRCIHTQMTHDFSGEGKKSIWELVVVVSASSPGQRILRIFDFRLMKRVSFN